MQTLKNSFRSQAGFAPILLLLVVVVAIVGGAYFVYTKYSQSTDLTRLIPNTSAQKKIFLSLESPNNNTVAKDNVVVIKGKTLPGSTVVLLNLEDEKILESDTYGEFESKMVLNEGENSISISAFTDDGQEKSVDVNVSYSSK